MVHPNVNKISTIDDVQYFTTRAFSTIACQFLKLIEGPIADLLENSEQLHFHCDNCSEVKYVYSELRFLQNFPVCIQCAIKSLERNSN